MIPEEKNLKKAEDDNKIQWFGLDGLLVLAFFAIAITMFCALKYRIDVLVGWVFPLILLGIVITVTVFYIRTLGGFIKMQNEKIASYNENSKKE